MAFTYYLSEMAKLLKKPNKQTIFPDYFDFLCIILSTDIPYHINLSIKNHLF